MSPDRQWAASVAWLALAACTPSTEIQPDVTGAGTSASTTDAGTASTSVTGTTTMGSGDATGSSGTTTSDVSASTTDATSVGTSGTTTDGTDSTDGSTTAIVGCGNGVPEDDEECDDMDADELDGCLSSCRIGPTGFSLGGDTALPLGGGGAIDFDDACPSGEVLIGVRGEVIDAIVRLQGVCGQPTLNYAGGFGVTTPETTVLPARGGGGGTGFDRTCADGSAVTGFSGSHGSDLGTLVIRCSPVTIGDDGTTFTVSVGSPTDLAVAGSAGPTGFGPHDCAAGQVARATSTAENGPVTGFRIVCAPLSLTFPP